MKRGDYSYKSEEASLNADKRYATLIGSSAVMMWGLLALFTTLAGNLPPFLLMTLSFSIASLVIVTKWIIFRENIFSYFRQPIKVWLLGIYGLFGYHALYFFALQNAPPIDASLIAYLWPLLIVIFSNIFNREKLKWFHFLGTFIAFLGTLILVTRGEAHGFSSEYMAGYLFALSCALIWSSYSVLNRKFGQVPTNAVGCFCIVVAGLSFMTHLSLEETHWPKGLTEWSAIVALGIFPVGIAFFSWDYGTKFGDISVLASFSYFAPLISTIALVVFSENKFSLIIGIACFLITGGALLSAKELLRNSYGTNL
ncbi:MAG: EamA family transporter [Pseudomonadota bacterium]|nr:EamA family transporter [Pseudomonadota bacterium]